MTAPHDDGWRTCWLEGVAFWSPRWPGWPQARDAFRGDAAATAAPAPRPSPTLLPAAERRRVPDTVAIALEVARLAVAASDRSPADLLSVFTSAHGDLPVIDAMCSTLATTPLMVSPTKFHNSVHNAASGYWGIATGCERASTALSGYDASFAAGLLEALTQLTAEQEPVLLVGCDVEAVGPLRSTNASRGQLGVALVVSPARTAAAQARLAWRLDTGGGTRHATALQGGAGARSVPTAEVARALADNALADALPFFEALAQSGNGDGDGAMPAPACVTLRLAAAATLVVQLHPLHPDHAESPHAEH